MVEPLCPPKPPLETDLGELGLEEGACGDGEVLSCVSACVCVCLMERLRG